MKKKLAIFVFLLFLFAGFVAIRFFILNKQNDFGKLKITSSPTASIFIDNETVGRTPFEQKYNVGEYVLKLIPEGTATDIVSWQGKIKVHKNALTYINRELGTSDLTSAGEMFTVTKMEKPPKNSNYGEILVETEPSGAIVYLDNDEKGVASLILADVIKGDHEVSVFMPRFFRRTQKINVDSGYRVNATFKLAIDQSQQPQASPEARLEEEEATESAKIDKSRKITPTPTAKTLKKPTPSAVDTNSEIEEETEIEATEEATTEKTTIVIKDTPTGFLRVRLEPSTASSEAARVKPSDTFQLLEEKSGWYKIEYEEGKQGWVSAQYADKK